MKLPQNHQSQTIHSVRGYDKKYLWWERKKSWNLCEYEKEKFFSYDKNSQIIEDE